MRISALGAVFVVLVAAGIGVAGVLVFNALDDSEQVIAGGVQLAPPAAPSPITGQGVAPAATPAAGGVLPAPTPVTAPAPTSQPAGPSGSADISPEMLEAAIAEAEANPNPPTLPTRNLIASELVSADVAGAGFDLTGVEITVYPAGTAPSFVLVSSNESAPLLSLDATASPAPAEDFFSVLLASPALDQFDVSNFVFQFSGTDEVGPFELTMLIPVNDLREALATGADVTGQLSVQVERP